MFANLRTAGRIQPSKEFHLPRNLTDTSASFIFDETRTWRPESVGHASKAPKKLL